MPLCFVHYIHGDMKSAPEKDMWEMYLLSSEYSVRKITVVMLYHSNIFYDKVRIIAEELNIKLEKAVIMKK